MDYEKCQCNDNWIGLSCETPTCYDVNNCSLNGLCVSPNKCECFDQFDGENCTEEVAVNINTPIFLNGSYFALVSENQAKGFVILTVSANDSDQGRSGQISYSTEEASIANFFMISQDSGEISVAADGVLDYESIPQKQFTFTVAATDNGIPTRSSEATVTIAVKDENDNCPVFKTLPGNYKIPVEILANDDDHGENGQIQYSITEESDPDQKFYITSNGTLLANSVLQPGAYLLTIVAKDVGDIPCARELSLTVVVDKIVLPTSTSIGTRASSAMSSTIALEPSSSLQSSTIVLEPSSPLQSSTIALKPSSSLQSSTIALESSSSFQSSTIAPEPSSSLQSRTIAPQPSSSLQSSTIAPEPSSSLSSTIAPEPSSSLESSTIALEPSSSSAMSSTIAPEPSSSLQSSTIALESSSSLQSSSIALEPSSSLQSSTVAPEQSSLLQSSTVALEPSSSLQRSTIATELSLSLQTIALSHTSLLHQSDTIVMGTTKTALLQPTETSSTDSLISSTQATTINHIVPLRMRLLNIGFVENYRNKNSMDYKNLRGMVNSTLVKVFKKVQGFLRISDVDFEEGSVIANIKTDFSSENAQVSTSTLARAVVDASDENGKLGELHSDTVFLYQQITPTTPPTTEGFDDDDDAIIGLAVPIGSAALICLILGLCLVSINNYLNLIRNLGGGGMQFVLRESASKTQAITRRLSMFLMQFSDQFVSSVL